MSYSEKCPGYRSYMECSFKEKRGADPHITDDEYKHNCVYDYDYVYCMWYSNCYITTAVCDTLGLKGDNLFLGAISSLRDKLKQDPKMFKQLEIYDIVGPIIANKINGDKKIALELFNSTIIPVCNDITKCDYRTAIIKYTNMTKNLIEKYKDSVSIGLDVFKMSEKIGDVKYGSQYKKSLNFGVPFRR